MGRLASKSMLVIFISVLVMIYLWRVLCLESLVVIICFLKLRYVLEKVTGFSIFEH